jgi:light-regulated signal transduction histidine kinase (bacteriophytochrome)
LSWVHPHDRDRIAQEMSEAMCTPNVYDTEYRILRPDGSHRWLHTRAHTIFRDGQCARIVGANIDITDRKHFEERLQEINRSLQQSNEDLEHFAHAVGHDLQEPLRTVSTCTALLSRRLNAALDEKAREYLAFIENSSKRMHDMLNSLLEYARRTGAGSSIPLEQTSAERVIQNAITSLRLSIEESDADIALDPLPEICANPELLAQVFQNLISNAIKYRRAEQSPQIRISATQHADKWTFAISDNGIGFEPQHKTSIFQLFKRLANANVAGNGIGLAVSKRIIEKHGGRMWAESEPGQGSTFYFSVPAISKRIQPDVSHT